MIFTKSDPLNSFYNNFWSHQANSLNLLVLPMKIITGAGRYDEQKVLQFLKQAECGSPVEKNINEY